MDAKDNTLYPLIILFFLLGLVVGYVIHKPEPVEVIKYVNTTVEAPKVIEAEKTAHATVSPASTPSASTATPQKAGFSVKVYDASKDRPSKTVELTNWRLNPDSLSISPGETVLFTITDYSLQDPMKLVLDSYEKSLGTSGAVVVTFNERGTYNVKAIIPSGDPNVIPRTYGEGTITVY